MKKKAKLKRLLAGAMSTVMTIGAVPIVSVNAEESTEPYPYAMFAASSADGAITINAGNFGINGNVSTNGTIESEGNVNINGTRVENANEDMIYIFDKIDTEYFSGNNVETYTEDYTLEEMNININNPLEVAGETVLTGNININTAVKAFENVTLNGEVKNTNNSVIFSKYGDIIIDSSNVNLNGLVYAPFGKVEITAQNLNLNNVVIIADSIIFNCPSVNANYSNNAAEFAGCISETLNIPYEEWQYMKDENENDIPDFFEDFDNWAKMSDTDSDGLPDSIEISIGSNPEVTDSDSDGLDDYYELMVSFTSPIKPDSDDNGINDGDEDFDKDGLTNFEEYSLATDPWEEDSDDDGLKDGEEVNNYGTNPLEPDTDFDGLIDSDEIYLGTDPNNPDTNGNGILDGDERSEQTIEQDIQVDDEKVAAITKVAVTFDCPGNIERYVTIENTYNIDMLSSDVVGIVGSPVDITSSVDFDNATITFTYDETLLNGTPEENLAILWYDEENKTYVILDEETVVDTENNTVSYTTTHFSTYLVIDREIWYDCWRENIDYRNLPATIETAYDIGFVVDVSGSMEGEYLSKAKMALNTFIDAMYPCDNAFLVKFNSDGNVVSKYGSSKSELKNAVLSLSAGGGTSTNSGLNAAMNEMIPHISSDNIPIIILICDGDVEYNDKTKNLIETAQNQENPIAIYTVNVCHSNSQALASIAAQTGGVSYDAATSEEIASAISYIQQKTVSSVDMTDSDGDGLYDVYEVKGMKIQNGQIIYTDPYNSDTDNDGISDFNEVGGCPINEIVKILKSEYSCVMCKINSNPVKADTDNDGYADYIDLYPNKFTYTKDLGSYNYITHKEIMYNQYCSEHPISNNSSWGEYYLSEIKRNSNASYYVLEALMKDVNECEILDLIKYQEKDTDNRDNWIEFCNYFNQKVVIYEYCGVFTEELHYFRNKLNRTPKSFKELIANKPDWILYSKDKSMYHMNNGDFDSTNPEYPSYSSYNNEYNLKFVDINGLNEVIVSPKDDIRGMSSDEIYNYLTNPDNWVILTVDKNNNDTNFRYDPVNVGTYNYCSYDKKIQGHDKKRDKDLHQKLDIDTFFDWSNVKGLFYGNSKKAKEDNQKYYYGNANQDVYDLYWKNIFE